jgi:hypothetical protein
MNPNPETDFSQYSADQCRDCYSQLLTDEMGKNGNNLAKATAAIRVRYPKLIARQAEISDQVNTDRQPKTPALSNAALSTMASPTSANCQALQLPGDIDLDLFTRCWKANKNRPAPLNAQAVFAALVDGYAAQRGVSDAEATAIAKTNCPNLAAMAGASGASDKLRSSLPDTQTGGITTTTVAAPDPAPAGNGRNMQKPVPAPARKDLGLSVVAP